MKRPYLILSLVTVALSAAVSLVSACAGNDNPPACNSLAACCTAPNVGGATSSCYETATAGELTDAECGQDLAQYQASGECPVDGGAADADASDAMPPKG